MPLVGLLTLKRLWTPAGQAGGECPGSSFPLLSQVACGQSCGLSHQCWDHIYVAHGARDVLGLFFQFPSITLLISDSFWMGKDTHFVSLSGATLAPSYLSWDRDSGKCGVVVLDLAQSSSCSRSTLQLFYLVSLFPFPRIGACGCF